VNNTNELVYCSTVSLCMPWRRMVEWRNRSRHFNLNTELRTGKHDIGLKLVKAAKRSKKSNC